MWNEADSPAEGSSGYGLAIRLNVLQRGPLDQELVGRVLDPGKTVQDLV